MYNINSLFTARKSRSQYQIERSLRFNSADSAYLNRTPASASNRKTWTWSGWVKRSTLTTSQWLFGAGPVSTDYTLIRFGSGGSSNDHLEYARVVGSAVDAQKISSAVYRDTSAWYHIVVVEDAVNTVARVYVNGSEIAYSTNDNPSNVNGAVNNTGSHEIGRYVGSAVNLFNGYLTEINFIDGYAYDPSYFGETDTLTGVWKPKKYTGTYGTNGFYLKFADNSGTTAATLGKDSSGNGNNFTPNNFSVTAGAGNDSLIDTPTPYADGGNGRGNYCTLNPLDYVNSTFSNGNLDTVVGTGSGSLAFGNFQMKSGKWYWEITPTSVSNPMIGVADGDTAIGTRTWQGANAWYYYVNGQKYNNSTGTAYGASFTTNDVIGVAYDADNGSLVFYKNGTSQGTAFTGLSGKGIIPALNNGASATSEPYTANFGQRPFSYTPPSGFKALNTQNLPEPSIKKPSSYMDAVLWTGDGVNGRVITTNIETVDFAWVKKRSGADDHRLANTVTGGNKHLKANTTEAESTSTTIIQAFSGSTFTVGSDNAVNASGGTYVGWVWKESATPGFDIVTYTGNGTNRTIAHSLGVAPSMIIAKGRTNTDNWPVGHTSRGWDRHILLNSSAAEAVTSSTWNNTAPTSSVFTVGTDTRINQNGITYVAYLWSEVAGFSKFGSYTGNGSADGPFVFCGFRPRWLMIKRTSSSDNWAIFDTARSDSGGGNVIDKHLRPDTAQDEQDPGGSPATQFDILSNGFKAREANGQNNASGGTYIFAAYAESPFKFALAR